VGVWGAYYNASNASLGELSLRAVNSILAYMPSTPNFAYHGSAAGWGDFSNNGKWMIEGGWEREGGHYRAGLNSIPLIERYRSHPDELYLLEVAMGGITGVLGNIDATGAPSMAFHLYPFVLAYDPRSGDHGLGFFGHALNVGAYVVRHPRLGTLCYLCDLVMSTAGPAAIEVDEAYTVTLHDSFRRRVYLAEIGLWLVLRTGQQIESVAVSSASLNEGQLVLTLVPTPEGWLSSTAFHPVGNLYEGPQKGPGARLVGPGVGSLWAMRQPTSGRAAARAPAGFRSSIAYVPRRSSEPASPVRPRLSTCRSFPSRFQMAESASRFYPDPAPLGRYSGGRRAAGPAAGPRGAGARPRSCVDGHRTST